MTGGDSSDAHSGDGLSRRETTFFRCNAGLALAYLVRHLTALPSPLRLSISLCTHPGAEWRCLYRIGVGRQLHPSFVLLIHLSHAHR